MAPSIARAGIGCLALLCSAAPSGGVDITPVQTKREPVLLFQSLETAAQPMLYSFSVTRQPRHRFYLELDGARAQAVPAEVAHRGRDLRPAEVQAEDDGRPSVRAGGGHRWRALRVVGR